MYNSRIGRFFKRDPLERQFAYNSPYNFSENRVIDAIELEGLEAWEVKNAWNDDYKAEYREYIKNTGGSGDCMRKYTCEDFGVAGLMEFARDNNLPFVWETETQTFDASSDEWEKDNYEAFSNKVMQHTGAPDFQNGDNTVENKNPTSIQPGSIITIDYNDDGVDHIQVSTSANNNGIITGAQGNSTGESPGIFGSGYDYYNPAGDNYVGQEVELWEWNLNDNTYTNYHYESTTENAYEHLGPKVLEFNFEQMNKSSNVQPPAAQKAAKAASGSGSGG